MRGTRAMTTFAADGQFREGGAFKLSVASGHRVGPAAVAKDASRHDGPVEAQIGELISRRGPPALGPDIKRERRLKEIAVLLQDSPEAIHSGADDPFDLVGRLEGLLAVGPDARFALVEISVFDVYLKAPVEPRLQERGRGRCPIEKLGRDLRHRTSHAGLREFAINIGVAFRAHLGPDIFAVRFGRTYRGTVFGLSTTRALQ